MLHYENSSILILFSEVWVKACIRPTIENVRVESERIFTLLSLYISRRDFLQITENAETGINAFLHNLCDRFHEPSLPGSFKA